MSFTKIVYKPCRDCGRKGMVLTNGKANIIEIRCADCTEKFRKSTYEYNRSLKKDVPTKIIEFQSKKCPKCGGGWEYDNNRPFCWCKKCGYEPGRDKDWVIKRQWEIIREKDKKIAHLEGTRK